MNDVLIVQTGFSASIRLFQLCIPGDEEVHLVRKYAWNEYKRLLGAVKGEVVANEILVRKSPIHPKLPYKHIDLELDPGKIAIRFKRASD